MELGGVEVNSFQLGIVRGWLGEAGSSQLGRHVRR